MLAHVRVAEGKAELFYDPTNTEVKYKPDSEVQVFSRLARRPAHTQLPLVCT
jgi:hypothetical protein